VVQTSENEVLKLGAYTSSREADMMRFVNEHLPSVPCPTVHSVDEYEQGSQPVMGVRMAYVPGQTLEEVWPTASAEEKTAYVTQLREIVQQLRQHTSPFIGSIGHLPCIDPGGFDDALSDMGPFDDEKSFNQYRLERVRAKRGDAVADRIASMQKSCHRFVLTHGDLSDRNIIVEKGRITGLIDWEFSGWYPEYWEWCQAQFSLSHDPYWRDVLSVVLDPYPDMAELEKAILGLSDVRHSG